MSRLLSRRHAKIRYIKRVDKGRDREGGGGRRKNKGYLFVEDMHDDKCSMYIEAQLDSLYFLLVDMVTLTRKFSGV